MPAVLGPAAQRIQADVAGYTHTPEPSPGQPVAATPTEVLHTNLPFEYGGLQHLFSEVPDPTHLVETAVVQPTSSVLGRLGGLVPHSTTPQAPGPQASHEPIHHLPAETRVVGSNLGTVIARARKWLGL